MAAKKGKAKASKAKTKTRGAVRGGMAGPHYEPGFRPD